MSSEFAGSPSAAAAELGVGLGQYRLWRGVGQYLAPAATVSIHRDSLDFCLPGGQVDRADVIDSCGRGQVDRLGNGGVDVTLRGGLYAQMPRRGNLTCSRERRPYLGRQLRIAAHSPALCDLGNQLVAV